MKSKIKFRKIKIDKTGCHLLIKVRINNKWHTLVLDTGASQTVLDYHIASSITKNKAEQLSDASSTGVGGEQLQSHIIQVEKFKIGDVIVHDSYFVLLDLQHVNAQYEKIGKYKIQGVLGGDILNAFDAVIDYKKSELVLSYKKINMNIEERKLKLIQWIVSLNDEKILSRVDSFRKKVSSQLYNPSRKMTYEELISELKQADDDFKNGKTVSIEELRKEIRNG